MYRTFNMGVGMVIVAAAPDSEQIMEHFKQLGQPCYTIGKLVEGNREVTLS